MSARPTSPHQSVYRFAYTMALSILHRITGVMLSVGLLILVWWLSALARGPDVYAKAETLLSGWFAKLLLAGWLASFCYHLCNGVRHLTWDAGLGMEKHEARRSGWAVVVAALVLLAVLGYLAFGGPNQAADAAVALEHAP